jgi:hypothetical protein
MRFIETPIFTADITSILSDEQYIALQQALLMRPDAGPIIPGGGGIRKLRWLHEGRGKRSGLRIIYYWEPSEDICYMLLVYSKTDQDDLTQRQLRIIRKLVKEGLG